MTEIVSEKMTEVNGITIYESELLKRNPLESYEKLKKSKVCVLGLGGIGSNVVLSLARAGIGTIKAVDFDKVEPSNLNRQQYRLKDIGKKKTDAIEDVVSEINPFVKIEKQDIKVDENNIYAVTEGYDIIVEAFDDAGTKAAVINSILSESDEKILISCSGMASVSDANNIKTVKRLENLYVCGDGFSDFEEYDGMISTRVSICANHQANVVIRLILNK